MDFFIAALYFIVASLLFYANSNGPAVLFIVGGVLWFVAGVSMEWRP